MAIRSTLLGFFVLWSLSGASAAAQPEAPVVYKDGNGAFHVDFTTPPVYDLSSHMSEVSDGGLVREMHVLHSASGGLNGAGYDTDGNKYSVIHEVKGSCKTKRGETFVTQKIRSIGSLGTDDPKEYRALSVFTGKMEGYGPGTKLVGFTETRSCLRFDYAPFSKKKITVCSRSLIPDQVFPHPSAGLWAIRLTFDDDGRNVYGVATVFISDVLPTKMQSHETTVAGRLDDGEVTFKLDPVDKGAPFGKITLRARVTPRQGATPPELGEILEVGGKILGQKFAEVF